MGRIRFCASIIALVAAASFLLSWQGNLHGAFLRTNLMARPNSARIVPPSMRRSSSALFSLPLTFEPGASSRTAQFVAGGHGLNLALTDTGIEFAVRQAKRRGALVLLQFGQSGLAWHGTERVRAESNYFMGSDRREWRTHVPHFARAETDLDGVQVGVYDSEDGLEYVLSLEPNSDPSALRLRLVGASELKLDAAGDVEARIGDATLRMRKPIFLERANASNARNPVSRRVNGAYILRADGSIGFHVERSNPRATLVIDPVISVSYSTFLGGAGSETAAAIATDSNGKLYIGGTTTSPSTFPESATAQLGPGTGSATGTPPAEFFIAKIDPSQSGANSLVYLTFLGGSATQAGGLIAVDGSGDVAITGTTTSTNFPVTDQSTPTSGLTNGGNDTTLSEIDPTGSKLLYSTLFGGSGSQSTQGQGGIALDSSGNVFIASDTSSTNLPVTSTAYTATYTSSTTDGFVAKYQLGATPHLIYCTYLGLDGEIGVGGIAVDSGEDAYVSGFTSDPNADFPSTNAIQSAYGGGAFDAFLMKISTTATGSAALGYATLLGGGGSDQAFAVALDDQTPPSAYITGTTSSTNFPTNGTVGAYQPALPSNATAQTSDAFLAVISQTLSGASVTTSLAYSTYLGGSQFDSGEGLAVATPDAVYVAGTAKSWDFPWHDNFQPFNGYGDAFVAKIDPTSIGDASLVYATPLGGTSPPGLNSGAQGNAIALGASGYVWIAGQTTSANFPTAVSAANGFQPVCSSCQESPPATDAFIAQVSENDTQQQPSLYFAGPAVPLNFGKHAIGSINIPSQFVAIENGGGAPLHVYALGIAGPNMNDFSLSGAGGCMPATIAPGGSANCSFEVNFTPSIVGPEGAFVQVTDDAAPCNAGPSQECAGPPQLLELFGEGAGLAPLPASLNFVSQIANTTSAPQTVTITNTSSDIIYIDDGPALGGDSPSQFTLQGQNSEACTAQASGIPANGSCQIIVEFTPSSVGDYEANVNLEYHVEGLAEQTDVIPLSGVATPPAPVATISPLAITFGTVAVGSPQQTQVVTLMNAGSAALDITSITITGTNASEFAVSAVGSVPCPRSSGSLAIGATCTVGVEFAPKSPGTKSASLTFTDNAAGSPQTVSLSGAAESTAVQISPTSLSFTSQSVGTKSSAQTVAITNSGASALQINGLTITGANAGDFTEINNCSVLSANANCTANVAFQPSASGTRTASLSISDDAPNSPQTVALTGVGAFAAVALAPSGPISFGNQPAGTASSATTLTVTNSGTGALSITKISFSGANATDFSETDTCSSSIVPAGNCTIQVTFKPQCGNNQAARTASLVLTDNAPNSPQEVALGGTATGDICFAPASGASTTATIAAGTSATYALDVSAATNYAGKVTLACSGAPSASSCTTNPTSATVAGSTLVPFTVNVTTTANSALHRVELHQMGRVRELVGARRYVALLFAAFVLGAMLAAARASSGRCRMSRGWLILVLLLFAMSMGLTACGSDGGGSAAVNLGTPAGSYTLTVIGTASDGTSEAIQLTLNVN